MGYFDYSEADDSVDQDGSWEDIKRYLEISEARQRKQLEKELRAVLQQLAERDSIHDEAVERIQIQIDHQKDRLRQIYRDPFGGDREGSEAIGNKLTELYSDLNEVHRQHWNDKQRLRQELQDIIRELTELGDDSLEEVI